MAGHRLQESITRADSDQERKVQQMCCSDGSEWAKGNRGTPLIWERRANSVSVTVTAWIECLRFDHQLRLTRLITKGYSSYTESVDFFLLIHNYELGISCSKMKDARTVM